jgi:hypothetical protein
MGLIVGRPKSSLEPEAFHFSKTIFLVLTKSLACNLYKYTPAL